MPELPEVETTRRGLAASLTGSRIVDVVVRDRRLRWPVPRNLATRIVGRVLRAVARRGKYLLLDCERGWLIVHLGMSGSLRVLPAHASAGKHDHVDFVLSNGYLMRLTDPRRFGAVLWAGEDPLSHPLLRDLAPEPFDAAFDASWLQARLARRRAAIKTLLMDNTLVAGVGNIYAVEALFRARIHPLTPGRRIGPARCQRLVRAIRDTLSDAICAGGSTLRNFVGSDGVPGYFQQQSFVYGRAGEPCRVCGAPIRVIRQGLRSTFYCPQCQRP